ncbi:MAG: hypothetical protein KBT34_11570 [Prevotella sp.]|nr:hypothetical protein [Candidatus Prevotella equi]
MKNKILLYILSAFVLVSCQEALDVQGNLGDAQEMQGLNLLMSRAAGDVVVAELKDYVGRSEFANNDVAVFTTIKRTAGAIDQFTYKDLEFICSVTETTKDGKTEKSTGWSRDPSKGTTAAGGETHPDRIYWSDALSEHTFIGFCKPQGEFDWVKKTVNSLDTYYGSLGDPTETGIIDYTSEYSGETETLSGNVKLCEDDILLTHSTEIVAEDAIAKLQFHHGLAQVRVIVNISDFAAGGGADTLSVVSNMQLLNMLTRYKWNQMGYTTEKLDGGDNGVLGITNYDQKKNVKLWIPNPKGIGSYASKTFTFYGLAVPTQLAANGLKFSFDVTYPNPMNPQTETVTKTYTASVPTAITFGSGKCTTINISLNHKNEKMTVGAEYMDWEFVDTPDQGSLKKNSTFLSTTEHDRKIITIVGDANANADDATWLYEKNDVVVDVYGNDGTAEHPYLISTANQLLSFAYEVKNGRTFAGQYVKLDADIHLQTTTSVKWIVENKNRVNDDGTVPVPPSYLEWVGIGDGTHAFNGNFIGGGRNITHLYGKAFFSNIGPYAIINELNLSDVIRVTDHAALAEQNGGFIYACRVEGEVDNTTSDYVGSLCGTNSGFVFACIHNGAVKGTKTGAKVGGLLGRNTGTLAVSYHTGSIDGTNTYGVVERAMGDNSKIYACYFNSTLATPNQTVDPVNVLGRTLGQMQSKSFADTDLNAKIQHIIDTNGSELFTSDMQDAQKEYFLNIIRNYHFVFTPGAYPRVVKK